VVITCPQCGKRYKYDEARFGSARSKRVKCTGCSHVFEVTNPGWEPSDSTGIGRRADSSGGTADGTTTDDVRLEPEAAELPELAPLPRDLRFSLAVIAGAQAGSVFPVTKPRVYLGRGSSMDIQLKDSEVSRRHVMLEVRGDQATLIDLGATNGTYVDGERIDRSELGNQSEFTVGSTTLMLIITQSGMM